MPNVIGYVVHSLMCAVICRFAIYVPLFVPVSLPLLLSTRSALKQLFKRKERAVEDTDGIGNIQLAEST